MTDLSFNHQVVLVHSLTTLVLVYTWTTSNRPRVDFWLCCLWWRSSLWAQRISGQNSQKCGQLPNYQHKESSPSPPPILQVKKKHKKERKRKQRGASLLSGRQAVRRNCWCQSFSSSASASGSLCVNACLISPGVTTLGSHRWSARANLVS